MATDHKKLLSKLKKKTKGMTLDDMVARGFLRQDLMAIYNGQQSSGMTAEQFAQACNRVEALLG